MDSLKQKLEDLTKDELLVLRCYIRSHQGCCGGSSGDCCGKDIMQSIRKKIDMETVDIIKKMYNDRN